MTRFVGPFLLLVTLTLAGCGPREVPLAQTVPVKGKVVLADGRPVTAGRVLFSAKGPDMGGVEPFGDLKKDGTFVLTTQKLNDGAVVGRYVVSIQLVDHNHPNAKAITSSSVPTKYRDSATSDLVVEVRPGDNDLTLTLK
jgi:hypothetical protein